MVEQVFEGDEYQFGLQVGVFGQVSIVVSHPGPS